MTPLEALDRLEYLFLDTPSNTEAFKEAYFVVVDYLRAAKLLDIRKDLIKSMTLCANDDEDSFKRCIASIRLILTKN